MSVAQTEPADTAGRYPHEEMLAGLHRALPQLAGPAVEQLAGELASAWRRLAAPGGTARQAGAAAAAISWTHGYSDGIRHAHTAVPTAIWTEADRLVHRLGDRAGDAARADLLSAVRAAAAAAGGSQPTAADPSPSAATRKAATAGAGHDIAERMVAAARTGYERAFVAGDGDHTWSLLAQIHDLITRVVGARQAASATIAGLPLERFLPHTAETGPVPTLPPGYETYWAGKDHQGRWWEGVILRRDLAAGLAHLLGQPVGSVDTEPLVLGVERARAVFQLHELRAEQVHWVRLDIVAGRGAPLAGIRTDPYSGERTVARAGHTPAPQAGPSRQAFPPRWGGVADAPVGAQRARLADPQPTRSRG